MPTHGGYNKKRIKLVESGGEYESIYACAQELGICETGISAQLRGKCKSYKGLHFEYVEDSEEKINE